MPIIQQLHDCICTGEAKSREKQQQAGKLRSPPASTGLTLRSLRRSTLPTAPFSGEHGRDPGSTWLVSQRHDTDTMGTIATKS